MQKKDTDYDQDMANNYLTYKNNDHYRTHFYLGTQFVLDELHPVQGKKILDFGCGNGYETFALAQMGAYVTGVDHSTDQIAFANEHNAHPNARYIQSTNGVLKPVIPESEKFDYIITNFVFCAIGSDETIQDRLNDFKAVLAENGEVIVLNNNPEDCDGKEFISWSHEKGIIKKHGEIFKVNIHGQDNSFDVDDFYRDDAFYISAMADAGLHVDKCIKPQGSSLQQNLWLDEVNTAPTVIFVATHKSADTTKTQFTFPIVML